MPRHNFHLTAIVCLIASPCLAESLEPGNQHEASKRHHVALFSGGTHVFSENHTAITYGVDYEYQLTPRFGIGGIVERAEGAIDATSIIALMDVHVTDQLVVQLGPGIEFESGEEIAIGRVGVYYEFELTNAITIAPSIGYDISEEHDALVFGLLVGRKF